MFKQLQNVLQNHANRRTREALLRMDERQLRDMGFSRELLLQGVDAWPWQTLEEQELKPIFIGATNIGLQGQAAGNKSATIANPENAAARTHSGTTEAAA